MPPFAANRELARAAGRKGAITQHKNSGIAKRLGLKKIPDGWPLKEYIRSGSHFRDTYCDYLATTVGDGYVSPAVASIVSSAALLLAWSRYYADHGAETGDTKMASLIVRLVCEHRCHLTSAYDLCKRETEDRRKARPEDPSHALRTE